MSSKRSPLLTRLSLLDVVKGIYYIQILVNMTYLLRGMTRFFGEGWRQHLSTVLGNISVHKDILFLNVTLLFFSFSAVISSHLVTVDFEFQFWKLFCTKGLLELNMFSLSQPKVSVLLCFVLVCVCVCQLNVITDPTALISIWYLIGRFASSILKLLFNLF